MSSAVERSSTAPLGGTPPAAAGSLLRPSAMMPLSACAVRVRVIGAVSATEGSVLPVLAARTGRQVVRGTDLELVAAVRALVRACGDVATGWDGIGHGRSFLRRL